MLKSFEFVFKSSCLKQILRFKSVTAIKLQYTEFGEPINVIQKVEQQIEGPGNRDILVKILASPINPADINVIQGKYPFKPAFPATGGNECVAEVIEVGKDVIEFKLHDRVIPVVNGLGTWTTYAIYPADSVLKNTNDLGLVEAATLTVNPCTAYRMLKDFVNLNPGDTIIQNGANSAVGQAVSQLCKVWKINNIGVVRNREKLQELKHDLKGLGATEVLTEEELRSTNVFKEKTFPKPKLALNCIGGKNALEISRYLGNSGVMVTYGGMSREPIAVPTASLIFKDIVYRGFWMAKWAANNYKTKNGQIMFDDLVKLMQTGQLKGPLHKMVPFNDYANALRTALDIKGFVGEKIVFDFKH